VRKNTWLCALTVIGLLVSVSASGGPSRSQADTKSVETAVLAVHDAMTRAGEAADADRLFSYMAETDKGSVIQNGAVLATRQEALDAVRSNLRSISKVEYTWGRRLVTVLSPEIAVLVAEGVATVTTATGDGFSAPLAQSVVFVLKDGTWKAIHAHNSSPRAR
jgi:uncharacterized protein (TIGR02246 family)